MVREGLKSAAAASAVALSFALYAASFEPFGVAEFAYIFAVPAILACRFLYANAESEARIDKTRKKTWIFSNLFFSYLAWVAILAWLRHVWPPAGYFAMFLLPLAVAWLFIFPWFALLPRLLPDINDSNFIRIARLGGIAGFWVALEWLRSWLFSGFPWLLLAHSQWLRPAVIQTAEYGGVWIVSFILIFFNLAAAEYIYRLFKWQKYKLEHRFERRAPFSRICPEFYLALLMSLAGMWIYVLKLPSPKDADFAFKAGLVQTDFAGILKWDDSLARENLEKVRLLTLALRNADVDVALLPEAATPPRWPIIGTPEMRLWTEKLARDFGKPIISGNMAYLYDERKSQNIAVYVSPENGLSENYYAKIKLVPFGEYIPSWASFMGKVVPVGTMKGGDSPVLLDAKIREKDYKIGVMICYEDVFPNFGRERVKNGADLLFVCTNDSWYGREAGAWQHAAHSALQAVSVRRPLMRSSNNGLSAVFDQYGRMSPTVAISTADGKTWHADSPPPPKKLEVRDERGNLLNPQTLEILRPSPLIDDEGSIYFRGAGVADVVFFDSFQGKETFYVRYGDWVVWISLGLFAGSLFLGRQKHAKKKLEANA